MSEVLEYVADAGVGVMTLNRPERLNALDTGLARAIESQCLRLRDDRSLRALIVRGAGRVFCAGADIADMQAHDDVDGHYRFLAAMQNAVDAVEALPVPTIAAVHGIAFGGGCELALACDFRLCEPNARLGVPEIKLGLIPGAGGTQRLSRLLPAAIAKQMIYLGEPLDAQTALHHGLVNELSAPGEIDVLARAWATRLAALAPLALRSGKHLVHGAALGGLANGVEAERQAVAYLLGSQDAQEGMAAFLAKRPPRFEGR